MSHFIETIANDNAIVLLRAAVSFHGGRLRLQYGSHCIARGMARPTPFNHTLLADRFVQRVAHMTASAILVSRKVTQKTSEESLLRFGTFCGRSHSVPKDWPCFAPRSAEAHRFPDLAQAVLRRGRTRRLGG
jgi:hypothetical protein